MTIEAARWAVTAALIAWAAWAIAHGALSS